MSKKNMNLYDLNKSFVSNLKNYDKEDFKEARKKINFYFEKNKKSNHHMLLCNDYRYYTIFEFLKGNQNNNFTNEVLSTLKDLGNIKSCENIDDNNAIEIWIELEGNEKDKNQIFVFYLFPYDKGVIYYE